MSRYPYQSPELAAAMVEVEQTFAAFTKARNKLSRCKRPEALELARVAYTEAEHAYRIASDKRDVASELDKVRRTQAGDPLGAHWARSHDGPAIDPARVSAATREPRFCDSPPMPSKPPKHRSKMTTRILGHSREPVAIILARQRAKFDDLEVRIGRLMSQRVELENIIADLQDLERRTSSSIAGAK